MIYQYTPVVTPGPNGTQFRFQNTLDNEATELAIIGSVAYVHVPEDVDMPQQHPEINWTIASLTDVDLAAIRAASPAVRMINDRVVSMIRERYSVNDEIKMLRIAPSDESSAYNDYVEACRAWGRDAKAEIGL